MRWVCVPGKDTRWDADAGRRGVKTVTARTVWRRQIRPGLMTASRARLKEIARFHLSTRRPIKSILSWTPDRVFSAFFYPSVGLFNAWLVCSGWLSQDSGLVWLLIVYLLLWIPENIIEITLHINYHSEFIVVEHSNSHLFGCKCLCNRKVCYTWEEHSLPSLFPLQLKQTMRPAESKACICSM